jgi:8-oxo-dGTP pyrophosphatase MutT (NUDIX family)
LEDGKSESAEDSALRELKEETGYIGTIKSISPSICNF